MNVTTNKSWDKKRALKCPKTRVCHRPRASWNQTYPSEFKKKVCYKVFPPNSVKRTILFFLIVFKMIDFFSFCQLIYLNWIILDSTVRL